MTGVAPDKTAILSLDTPAAGDDALRTVLGAPAGCKLRAAPEHLLVKTGCESIVVGNLGADLLFPFLAEKCLCWTRKWLRIAAETSTEHVITISDPYDLSPEA